MTSVTLAPARPRAFEEALASPRIAGALYALLTVAMASPAWIWPIPRGTDYVNHWARLSLYSAPPDDPARALYHIGFGLIPNLGVDGLYLALSWLLSPQTTIRLAFALSIVLPTWGAWRLHRALFEKISPTIWLAPVIGYNIVTYVGLVNYGLGMGVALLGLAFVAGRGERLKLGDYAFLNLIGGALFFCHLIALAAFMLLFGLLRLGGGEFRWRAAFLRAANAAPALAAPVLLCLMRQTAPSTYGLNGSKFLTLIAPVLTVTDSDMRAFVVLLGLIALVLVIGLRVAPAARLALAGFGLAAWLAPSALGAANFIDARLVVFWWYFALAATSLKRPEGFRALFAGGAVCLVAVRLWTIAPAWERFQELAVSTRQALAALPAGSRALVVQPQSCNDPELMRIGALTAFALTDRRSYANTIFAQSGMQPIAAADPALDGAPSMFMDARWLTEAGRATLEPRFLKAPWAAAFVDWRQHFTHVVDFHGTCQSNLGDAGLTRIGGGPGLDVYEAP